MKKDSIASVTDIGDINSFRQKLLKESGEIEKKRSIYKNYYKSKWSNLKFFIQDKTSLQSCITLLKKKTIEQFSKKCLEIYKKKLEIHFISKKNKEMFISSQSDKNNQNNQNNNENNSNEETNMSYEEILSKLKVQEGICGLPTESICDFLFQFREDNNLMMRFIECLDTDQFEIVVPFLCHFFYENFYIENNEQEEILYIIYLLLEKEIDSLYTPSVSTFLDKSFVSMFLSQMGNRYEIKHYIDIILNYLIRDIEETNISFYSLNIEENCKENKNEDTTLKTKKENKKFGLINKIKDLKIEDFKSSYNTFNNNFNLNNGTFTATNISSILKAKNNFDDNFKNNNNHASKNKNETKLNLKEILQKELYDILYAEINEKYIRDKLEKETNDIMRHFYMRLLRQIKAANNSDLYNTSKYYKNLDHKILKKEALEIFNKGYFLVTKFITELLDNLDNNKIMPYPIKVICKFIFTLLSKKFPNISTVQAYILVNRFLFDKLLLPVIQNPDINDTGINMIITLTTKQNLFIVYKVLKKLIRGELFNTVNYSFMTVFNIFIINNFGRLNKIMEKLLRVSAPRKLMKLSEEFYNNENFNLDEVKRDKQSINYEHFKENPHDFMNHKSICFSVKELKLFFNVVDNNKERFIQSGDPLEKIFENVSTFMPMVKSKQNEYFVIIRDNYNDDVNELLFLKEPKMILSKTKTQNDLLFNLKYCISYLISKLDMFPNWVFVAENLDTINIFKYIDSYLNSYYNSRKGGFATGTIPLNWYSLYIINNLENLDEKYKENDFQLLYDNLESEIVKKLQKFRILNNFLTINMTTKNILIDSKIKIYVQELEKVKSTELNIKTVKFMESAKINICLTSYMELNDLVKYFNTPLDSISQAYPYTLIISKEDNCIHQQKMEKKTYSKLKEGQLLKNLHCSNINEFAKHLGDYYSFIRQDILDSYNRKKDSNDNCVDDQNSKNPKVSKKKNMNEIHIISKKTNVKEVLDQYISYITEAINESNIFSPQKLMDNEENNLHLDDDSNNAETPEEKQKKLIQECEEEKEKSINIIYNYILKRISIKIYEAELDNEDEKFRSTCIKLKWITHKNLEIPDEVFDKTYFNQVIDHVKRLDYLRTPKGMLYEFGLGVQLINSMFIFMMNQREAEAGDLLPMIIYSIISAKPKKIIFNLKFMKFFIKQSQLLGNIGYNLIQCESSISYIKQLNEKQLKMDRQEFLDRCQLSMQEYLMLEEDKKNTKTKDNKSNFKNILKNFT